MQNGLQISKGAYIGFKGDDILCAAADRNSTAADLCRALDAGSRDVALVFAGADASEDAAALQASLSQAYPLTEFMFHDGGQAVFDYIIVLC